MTDQTPPPAPEFTPTAAVDTIYYSAEGKLTDVGRNIVRNGFTVFARACWLHAEAKGFHGVGRTASEELMLIASEVFEAFESVRNNEPNLWYRDKTDDGTIQHSEHATEDGRLRKPEGKFSELADVFVRLGDTVGGSDEMIALFVEAVTNKNAYNSTRPALHGGKSL
ncbi:MazG-like nucleotide pyrophosphohydrolase [Gordonia phage Camerico]|nr:MazG-like nucleotide pyrophosphohydrolase [Gordonia phage Camerico]